jgi:hypothetical protein
MDHSSRSQALSRGSPHCGRPDLAQRLAAGEELAGAFADELAAHSQGCSSCSVRLSLVQQAERWLADHASSNRAAVASSTPCPSAEELYDFGRGPGARGLTQGSERRIQAHLVDCEDCRGLVATLATRPPAPVLDAGPVADSGLDRASRPRRQVERAPAAPLAAEEREPARRPWIAFAAAAAAVAGALYLWNANRTSHAGAADSVARGEIAYPQPKLLRGSLADALLMPHGRVLASLTPGEAGTWQPLHFQVVPRAGATNYEVVLERTPTSAWKPAEPVAKFHSESAHFDLPADVARTLTPGKYTWEVWARVNGLASSLGRRGFEIVDAPSARETIERGLTMSEPQRSSTILAWLTKNEYEFDAFAYAGSLPRTPERDGFMDAVLGR